MSWSNSDRPSGIHQDAFARFRETISWARSTKPRRWTRLVVGFVEVAFDGGVLDGAVHSFDLAVGPRVFGLCQPMIDVVLGAGVFEGVRPNGLSGVKSRLDVRRG